jgi:CspA family cold shock protein
MKGQKMTGVIKTVLMDKRFGFIVREDGGGEVFFHSSGVQGAKFEDLRPGTRVRFLAGVSPKGPRAEQIELA